MWWAGLRVLWYNGEEGRGGARRGEEGRGGERYPACYVVCGVWCGVMYAVCAACAMRVADACCLCVTNTHDHSPPSSFPSPPLLRYDNVTAEDYSLLCGRTLHRRRVYPHLYAVLERCRSFRYVEIMTRFFNVFWHGSRL